MHYHALLALSDRVARLAVLRPSFKNLAVFEVSWPYDFPVGRCCFFGRFHGCIFVAQITK